MNALLPFAFLELAVMWLAWFYPFLRQRFTAPRRQSNVMAPSSRWGIALEMAGIFCAFYWAPGAPPPGSARMIVSMLLAPVGTVFGWWSVRHLGKQLRILAGLYPDHELIRTGPYAIVRHPVYASMFVMMLATGLLCARWPMLLLGIVLYIVGTEVRIRAEEGLLRARFGDAFEEYRRKVPAYLPFLR